MPTAPLTPCGYPGCPVLGPCAEHQRASAEAYDGYRGTAASRGYDADHRRWAKAIIARDPICKICGRVPSTIADHVIPITEGGARLDERNGQGVCHACHEIKKASEKRQRLAPRRHELCQPTGGRVKSLEMGRGGTGPRSRADDREMDSVSVGGRNGR